MRKIWLGALTAGLASLLLSCGGGGTSDSVDARPFGPGFGAAGGVGVVHGLIGLVVDANTGSPISGVTVSAGSLSTTTDGQGNFAMPTIPNGTSVVSFTLAAYAPQSRTVQVISTIETSVIVQMVPNGSTSPSSFDPLAAATLTVTGSTAQLAIGANTLRHADGTAPAASNATAVLTPIGPSLDAYLLPGEYVFGTNSSFETFGGLDVRITDNAGLPLTTLTSPATIRIPVNTRSGTLPASVALLRFDPVTGLWVQDGSATLMGSAPNQFYEGTVNQTATWAAAQGYTPSNISICVQDTNGNPVAGARVYSDGIDYSGGGTAWTDASGNATVAMKSGGQAVISANSPRSSNSITVPPAPTACLIMPTAGMTIRLTWGASPSDLDSHLKGPNNFHIAYFSPGSLSNAPFARLDVDDTSSFGPEVITITRLTKGVHEYFVHNFSRSVSPSAAGMTPSPTRVEVRVGSQIAIYRPGTGEGANEYWRVFQFTVNPDCSVALSPLTNSWAGPGAEPANPAGSAGGAICN
jgi:hypothetical protein